MTLSVLIELKFFFLNKISINSSPYNSQNLIMLSLTVNISQMQLKKFKMVSLSSSDYGSKFLYLERKIRICSSPPFFPKSRAHSSSASMIVSNSLMYYLLSSITLLGITLLILAMHHYINCACAPIFDEFQGSSSIILSKISKMLLAASYSSVTFSQSLFRVVTSYSMSLLLMNYLRILRRISSLFSNLTISKKKFIASIQISLFS